MYQDTDMSSVTNMLCDTGQVYFPLWALLPPLIKGEGWIKVFSKPLCLQIITDMPCSILMVKSKTGLIGAFSISVAMMTIKGGNFLGLSGRQP